MKKTRSEAEIRYRKERSDARWEIREEYLMVQFSRPTTALPRQIGYLREQVRQQAAGAGSPS
jgi:hypothetical protein